MKNNLLYSVLRFCFICVVISLPSKNIYGQVPIDVQLFLSEPFPSNYALIASESETFYIIIKNNSDIAFDCNIRLAYEGTNNNFEEVFVRMAENYLPIEPITLEPEETRVLSSFDIADLYGNLDPFLDLISQGVPLSTDGELPSGEYVLCANVTVYPEILGSETQYLSARTCSETFSVSQNNIVIEYPYDGDVVPLIENPLRVQWSSISSYGNAPGDQEYIVRIYEQDSLEAQEFSIYDAVNDGSAMLVYESEPTMESQLFYEHALGNFELVDGYMYAVQVEVVETDGAYFENSNFSNIHSFWYGHDPTIDTTSEEDEDGDGINDELGECYDKIHYTEEISENQAFDVGSFSEFAIGYHTVHTLDEIEVADGLVSGKGVVTLPFLMNVKVAVEFDDLKVNQEGRVYEGTVLPRDDSQGSYDASALSQSLTSGSEQIPTSEAEGISDIIYNTERIAQMVAGTPLGVPLGYDGDLQGETFSMVISNMAFYPDKAYIDLMTLLNFNGLFEEEDFIVAFGAANVTVIPDGIGAEYMLHPTDNIVWELPGDIDFMLYGMSSNDHAEMQEKISYLQLNCEGLESFALRGEFMFPRDVFVPDEDGSIGEGKVGAEFGIKLIKDAQVELTDNGSVVASPYYIPDVSNLEISRSNHLLLSIEMDRFQIPGLEGWAFELQDGYLDMSERENPPNMVFPENYVQDGLVEEGELERFWKGAYLKDILIYPPSKFHEMPESAEGVSEDIGAMIEERPGIGIQNFIFDSKLSLDFVALNILEKGSDNINGWGIGLDTLKLSILQNTFEEGRLAGSINTPILGKEDFMEFKAIIDQDENNKFHFNAVAKPATAVTLPLLFAEAGLCPNSYVSFSTNPADEFIEAFIKGQMSVDVLGNIEKMTNLDMDNNILPELKIKLADFQMNYNSADGFVSEDDVSDGTGTSYGFGLDLQTDCCGGTYTGPFLELGEFEDTNYDEGEMNSMLNSDETDNESSAQESLGGFPLSISGVELDQLGLNEIGFNFDLGIHFNGEEETAGGDLHMNLLSEIDFTEGLKSFSPNFPTLTGVSILYEKTPLLVDGTVLLVKNEDGSTGFHGDIELGLDTDALSFVISTKAGYAKEGSPDDGVYGSDEYYGWWYVDGSARWSPGIPVVGPVMLNGFGGGIYWNCDPVELMSMEAIMSSNGSDSGIVPDLNIEGIPTPNKSSKAFNAKIHASLFDDNVLMISGDTWLSWGGGDNQFHLAINGDAYLFAPSYINREESWIWGSSHNSLIFQKEAGNKLQAAYLGQNQVYLNLLGGALTGAGANGMLGSQAFAMASEELYEHPSNVDDDNLFWHFLMGDPYNEEAGPLGIKLDIAALFSEENAPPEDGEEEVEEEEEEKSSVGGKVGLELSTYFMLGQGLPDYLPEPGPYLDQFGGSSSTSEGTFSGGGIEAGEGRSAESGGTGQGFIMGLNLEVHAEISAILYASLSIFAGIDMMVTKEEGRACIVDNVPLANPGIDGWYGQGRAYVGLTGAIGAKGKLFGKEIDVKVLDIAAGMMLEAGGVGPTWLDGRADLQYNLLNGLVQGDARMNINVGNKCEPPRTSPFDFPIIDETYPRENMADIDEVDPYVKPSATFMVPLDQIMTVLDAKDEEWKLKPYLKEFSIKCVSPDKTNIPDNVQHDPSVELLSDSHRSATYDPNVLLARTKGNPAKSTWRMTIVVRAKEEIDGIWKDMIYQGKLWEEIVELDFQTTELPPYIQEMGRTTPNENQQYFLQEEFEGDQAMIKMSTDLADTHFYNKNFKGRRCSYHAILKEVGTNKVVEENSLNYYFKYAKYLLPTLENNKAYYYQLIRRYNDVPKTSMKGETLEFREIAAVNFDNILAGTDTESSYTINTDTEELNPELLVGVGEELLYKYQFKTSKFNTLADKLASLNIDAEKKNHHHLLTLGDFEGFDEIDMYGFDSPEGEEYDSPPRVIIEDLFESPFTDSAKELLGGFWENYMEEYSGSWTGCNAYFDDQGNPVDGNELDGYALQGLEDEIEIESEGILSTGSSSSSDDVDLFEGEEIPVNFIGTSLNYSWGEDEDFNGVYKLYEYLNDYIKSGIKENDDPGSTMANEDNPLMNHYISVFSDTDVVLKYLVTQKIMDDAIATVDLANEQELVVLDENDYNNIVQQYSIDSNWIWQLLRNLRVNRDEILESALYDGISDVGIGIQTSFTNKIRFTANKSYDFEGYEEGTTFEKTFTTKGTDSPGASNATFINN